MTITQLYLAIGVPMLFNGALILLVYQALNQRISDLREDVRNLTSKVVDLDNRLTRVEAKLHIE